MKEIEIKETTLEESFIYISKSYENINSLWKEELNSFGHNFGYDEQSFYKVAYELFVKFNFTEKEKSTNLNNLVNSIIEVLIELLKQNIYLYENYKKEFNKLDRTKTQLEFYRKRTKSLLSDYDLNICIIDCKETMNRDDYYKSSFYNDYGFLSEDFHSHIYFFSRHLLKSILEKFKNYLPYDPILLKYNKIEFFSLKLIGHIYDSYNGKLFEPISQLDFYKELNFLHSVSKLKKREKQNQKIYYLIHKLSETLPSNRKTIWTPAIVMSLGLDYRDYLKRKTTLNGSGFAEEVSELIV